MRNTIDLGSDFLPDPGYGRGKKSKKSKPSTVLGVSAKLFTETQAKLAAGKSCVLKSCEIKQDKNRSRYEVYYIDDGDPFLIGIYEYIFGDQDMALERSIICCKEA